MIFKKPRTLAQELEILDNRLNAVFTWMRKAAVISGDLNNDIEIMRKKLKKEKILKPADERRRKYLMERRHTLTQAKLEADEIVTGIYRDIRHLLAVHV